MMFWISLISKINIVWLVVPTYKEFPSIWIQVAFKLFKELISTNYGLILS